MKKNQIRQGDVLINAITALPQNLKCYPRINGRLILAEGEVTGHAHAIVEECESYIDIDGNIYLSVEEDVEIQHEEHGTLVLTPGLYIVPKQREFSDDMIQNVLD